MPSHSPSPSSAASPLRCPFCGQEERERVSMEGTLVVIFPCMFSPALDGSLTEEEVRLAVAKFAEKGSGYFQEQCDRLHYFVTKGASAVLPPGPPVERP